MCSADVAKVLFGKGTEASCWEFFVKAQSDYAAQVVLVMKRVEQGFSPALEAHKDERL
jgi:hypothetical protein